MNNRPFVIATRGSALALAQANLILDQCRKSFPTLRFELKVIKTTGDKLLSASMASPDPSLPKGLFTKELEAALLKGRADLAVHSLKDLPTILPPGLVLAAVSSRADPRDVLIYRDAGFLATRNTLAQPTEWTPGQAQLRGFSPGSDLERLPDDAVIATSSTRRQAQVLAVRPRLRTVEIRGNVVTRLQKLAEQPAIDAILLAAAGLERLSFTITPDGRLIGDAVPDGLRATLLSTEVMLPCVGQAALGIETRESDERVATLCQRLNHYDTLQCVTAERAFLRAMGGGCQSPLAAHAVVLGELLHLSALSFRDGPARRAEARRDIRQPEALGEAVAARLSALSS